MAQGNFNGSIRGEKMRAAVWHVQAGRLTRVAVVFTAILLCTTRSQASAPEPTSDQPRIQLAILLDTSNSMDGLIGQAKSQLWRIVNALVPAQRNGITPTLEVALYEYGNAQLSEEKGWVRQILPFSADLDLLSEMLFGLNTSGGNEYCGLTISRALDELTWDENPNNLRAIFIAGNEPFDQGPIDYRGAAARAASKGILVNTIFCGDRPTGIGTFWQDGASLAAGSYFHIDQNLEAAHIAAPQDGEIEALGIKLNNTYIPYGPQGNFGVDNQTRQDSNAQGTRGVSNVDRQVFKGSALYCNDNWDLVDGCRTGKVSLEKLPVASLPAIMQNMTPKERSEYLENKQAERLAIQKQITVLNTAREAYIAKERLKLADSEPETLDVAMVKAVEKMALDQGFSLD